MHDPTIATHRARTLICTVTTSPSRSPASTTAGERSACARGHRGRWIGRAAIDRHTFTLTQRQSNPGSTTRRPRRSGAGRPSMPWVRPVSRTIHASMYALPFPCSPSSPDRQPTHTHTPNTKPTNEQSGRGATARTGSSPTSRAGPSRTSTHTSSSPRTLRATPRGTAARSAAGTRGRSR